MRILFIADVVGRCGVELLKSRLPSLKRKYGADLTVVNGENSAPGNGITEYEANALFAAGADVISGGNHSFDRGDRELFENPYILRPLNWNTDSGHGSVVYDAVRFKVGIISVSGAVNMMAKCENPFILAKNEALRLKSEADTVIVDFHAEASSEKRAMGFWLDGIATAVIGTHTHCQTNDAEILENGTAFISDAGFCGSLKSVLGVRPGEVLDRFANGGKQKLVQEDIPPYLINGVVIECEKGKAVKIEVIKEIFDR
ncbi:MAG: YmdB family metallophosphoesterase [Clostridia bacterium]|nr:YmdB family metallophosphoesterase [Clostridia bacterium]